MGRDDSENSLKSGGKSSSRRSVGNSSMIPVIVVFGTVAGFMALAWYAYQAGSQSVKEDDLLVVEADKTPVKEKPSDPGGMQFPNQDKTIFDTFSGNNPPAAKVERVLPQPEEPISKNIDTSETKTWINDKLHKADAPKPDVGKPEQVIGNDGDKISKKSGAELAVAEPPMFNVEPAKKDEAKQQAASGDAKVIRIDNTATVTAAPVEKTELKPLDSKPEVKPLEAKAPEVKAPEAKAPEAKTEEPAAPVVNKTPAFPAQAAKAPEEKKEVKAESKPAKAGANADKPAGKYSVQLGAYRSEKEAIDDWIKLQKKYKPLATMSPNVVKADLGAKGVYYRLRTGSFASTGEAKAFCNTMTILGQACLLPTN